MTATPDPVDSYAQRASRVLRARETRDTQAFAVHADRSDADAARTDLDRAVDCILELLPLTDMQTSRWDDVDAVAAGLLLEEIARATSDLRLLTDLARAHLAAAADALQAVEKAR